MKLDDVKKLHQKKYREQFGYFLVEGEHLVLELEKTNIRSAEVFVTEDQAEFPTRFKKHIISAKNMAQISDTKTPQGVLAIVPQAEINQGQVNKTSIYLYEIQDPGNLGTILRSLAWFGNISCLLSPGCVDPFNPKVVRSSMGAIFHVNIEQDVPLQSLPGRFNNIACLTMQGAPLSSPAFKQHDCYLFGNEARGVPEDFVSAHQLSRYTISGSGKIDSLNLASAVNMGLYELQRS